MQQAVALQLDDSQQLVDAETDMKLTSSKELMAVVVLTCIVQASEFECTFRSPCRNRGHKSHPED